MTAPQQQIVLDLLHAPRFADQAPAEIYASLLDEGVYHCSIRTMYRILGQHGEVRERAGLKVEAHETEPSVMMRKGDRDERDHRALRQARERRIDQPHGS